MTQPAVEFQHMLHGPGSITSLRIDDVVSTTVNSATVRRGQTKFASQVPTAPLATKSIVILRIKNKAIPACPLLPLVLLRALPHGWPYLCSGVVLAHPYSLPESLHRHP